MTAAVTDFLLLEGTKTLHIFHLTSCRHQ